MGLFLKIFFLVGIYRPFQHKKVVLRVGFFVVVDVVVTINVNRKALDY